MEMRPLKKKSGVREGKRKLRRELLGIVLFREWDEKEKSV